MRQETDDKVITPAYQKHLAQNICDCREGRGYTLQLVSTAVLEVIMYSTSDQPYFTTRDTLPFNQGAQG